MRIGVRAAYAAAGLLGGATIALSEPASADVGTCATGANVVYVAGSSAFQTVLQAVANVLGSSVTIVYQAPGSCQGLQNILENVVATGSAKQLVPNNSTPTTCTLPVLDGGGTPIDVGLSDVFPATCKANYDAQLPSPLPNNYKDFLGPVQAMTFAVPTASTQSIISAEAAYMVFGFAAGSQSNTINPWSVPGDIYVRKNDSGTLEMLGTAISLPAQKWVNSAASQSSSPQQASGTGGMQTDIVTSGSQGGTHANSTIGILSTAGLTTGIKALAFQGTGQKCSYLPDSSSTATDKINVRQGRYEVWGPEHMVSAVDGNGNPVGQNGNTTAVLTLINALLSTSQAPAAQSDAGASDAGDGGGATTLGETEIGQIISAISVPSVGFIPWCAMQVSRTSEIGAEASYAPPAACSCAFEFANGSPISNHTCTACTSDNESTVCTGATPKCHFGYCEAE